MSLLFNMLSRLVIAFLPRRKHLLISWLQSPSAVILEPKTIKSLTVSIVSPSICHEVMGLDAALLQYNSITLLFYAVNVLNYMFIHRVNTTYICNYCFMWSSFKKEKKIYTQTYLCCNLYLWIHTHTHTELLVFSDVCVCVLICLVMSNSLQPDRLLYRWNFPGKNTEEGCHFLLQGIL